MVNMNITLQNFSYSYYISQSNDSKLVSFTLPLQKK
jgi:hypothetical protein